MTDLIAELKALKEKATPGPWFTTGAPWFTSGSGLLAGSPDPHAGCWIGDLESWDGEREEHVDNHEGCKLAHPDDDAALIAALVNNLPTILAKLEEGKRMREALEKLEAAELAHANCDLCDGEGIPELCEQCFPEFDDARLARRAALEPTHDHT